MSQTSRLGVRGRQSSRSTSQPSPSPSPLHIRYSSASAAEKLLNMLDDVPILRLPDELLGSIVALSRLADSRCVPELRLTCRRFGNVAAKHLILRAMVDFSRPSTLSRLDAITRHHAIASGVQEICVCVHFYNELAADEFETFVAFVTSEWNEKCRRAPTYSTRSDQE